MRRKKFHKSGITIFVTGIAYHRNGVSGNGFHVVTFTFNHKSMAATVFACASDVAVITLSPSGVNVDDKWRGDVFEPVLREAIAVLL